MKAAATLLTIATVAMASQATMLSANINFPQIIAQNSTVSWAQSTRFVSACARGFITGYRKGMYKTNNFRVDDKCFGTETQQAIVDTFNSWGAMNFDWNRELSNLMIVIRQVTDFCEYDESIYDYLTYCYQGDMCEPQNMVQTLLKKVFQVTTIANDFAQIYMEGLPTEADTINKIEDFGERVGMNIGKLLRYATEFDPTIITNLYQ
jgi:hypothetical protein